MARIRQRVQESLVAFEPRVDVVDVTVTSEPDTRFVLQIAMTYRVRGTNSLSNLVYPFYLQEGSR